MNILVCGVGCDQKYAAEIKRRNFEIGGIMRPFETMEIMATSNDYAENAPSLRQEALQYYNQIQQEIKDHYKPDQTEKEAAVHKKFSGYIESLAKIIEDACSTYDKIFSDEKKEAEVWKDAKESFSNDELTLERYKLRYMEARRKFEDDLQALQDETEKSAQEIRESLSAHLKAFYTPSAENVDESAVALLELGILEDDELSSFTKKFRNNPTMLRVIARFSSMRNTDAAKSLTIQINKMGKGEKELKIFDNFLISCRRCIDPKGQNLSTIGRRFFDRDLRRACDEIDGLLATPSL